MSRKHADAVARGEADPNNETELMRVVKHHLNVSMRCRLVRNNVGLDMEKGVRYGLGKGSPDLVGVLPSGHNFCIETKMIRGRVSDDQKAWWRSAIRWGVRGGVVKSIAGAWRCLRDAEQGITFEELQIYE